MWLVGFAAEDVAVLPAVQCGQPCVVRADDGGDDADAAWHRCVVTQVNDDDDSVQVGHRGRSASQHTHLFV